MTLSQNGSFSEVHSSLKKRENIWGTETEGTEGTETPIARRQLQLRRYYFCLRRQI